MAASFSFQAPIESTKDQKPRFDPGFCGFQLKLKPQYQAGFQSCSQN